MPIVQLGDKTVSFPDDMQPEEINAVISRDVQRAQALGGLFQSQPESRQADTQRGPRKRTEASTQDTLDAAAMSTMGVPIVGDVAGLAADAHMYANDPDSHTWYNYLFTAMGILPFVPAASQVRKAMEKITAYHGSPHDFDKFSIENIGTGEGAQAYGHGLYFAESEDVARGYRDALQKGSGANDDDVMARVIQAHDGDLDAAAKTLGERGNRIYDNDPDGAQRFWNMQNKVASGYNPSGRMYQVEIDATPDELLDWDLPLSEQSEASTKAVREIVEGNGGDWERVKNTEWTGGDFYKNWRGEFSDFGMAEDLRSAGVKGIRYKDGFSRGAEGGTSNYVIFDDRLITISKKYGVAIPVAAAILAKEFGGNPEEMYQEET